LKGIILHGGHGTRLRPLTHTGPKQLLPIANKPMSQYALEDLRNVGIKEIAIILGDIYPEKVKEYYGNGEKFGVKITYIYQDQPLGISHAIKLCKDFVGNDRFVVYLGDNVLRKQLVDFTKNFEKENTDAMILLCQVPDPSRFGVAEVEENQIKKISEKPKDSKSDLAVIGIYFLTPKIFGIIDKLKPSGRGELEITEALQLLLEEGNKLTFDTVTGWWKDTGTPEDILHANKLILDSIGEKNQFVLDDNYKVQGNIALGQNLSITNDSLITGPVIIGDNCKIGPKARIGPYVSIGNNSTITNCEIENSIIMNDCKIDCNSKIVDSIIATGSSIGENSTKKHQFLLGERSQVSL